MNFESDLSNIERINNFIQNINGNTAFGEWTFKQLIIHIWSWDLEMIGLLEAQMSGNVKSLDYDSLTDKEKEALDDYFQFEYQSMGIPLEEWNELMLNRHKDKSVRELKQELNRSRISLVMTYRKHIERFKDQPEVTKRTISIWRHDLHHIKKGGFNDKEVLGLE